MRFNINMQPVYLINYNNESRIPVLPQNLIVLKEYIMNKGGSAKIIDFNLTKDSYWEVLHGIDEGIIGLGFISGYWPHNEAIIIAEVIKNHPKRDKISFVIGGHAPTAAPRYYRDKLDADAVFVGTGERAIVRYAKNEIPKSGIYSCQYVESDPNLKFMPLRENIGIYKRINFPLTKTNEFAIQILSGRGCPYHCAFCAKTSFKYAPYSCESIINEIRFYAMEHHITHFQFSDELFMVSKNSIETKLKLLDILQDEIGRDLHFDCNGRLNMADPKILKRMKQCGFRYVNYGCESMSDKVLENINKQQTVQQIYHGIEATLAAGLSPGLNFMWGNPGDTYRTLWHAVEFIEEYSDHCELRTIRPVTPYPGTKLFEDLGIDIDYFYDKSVNSDLFSFQFMNISNKDANAELYLANRRLIENHANYKLRNQMGTMSDFYNEITDPKDFRGFRDV
jgi:anaerobic magnesium-protoporphyrin IX monomethyl ester cyclase